MNSRTLATDADLLDQMDAVIGSVWPSYVINHSPVGNRYWYNMMLRFPDFQAVLLDDQETIAAVVNSVPVHWDEAPEGGWDVMVTRAMEDQRAPNTLMALSVSIAADYQGQGLSREALKLMHNLARAHGYNDLYAPVRPSHKHHYPLLSIDDYVNWKRADGQLFDLWLRTHSRMGASLVKVAHESMRIEATVEQWSAATGLSFLQSGKYVVPGALNPIDIDLDQDVGLYVEPNVWMHHSIRG